MQAFAMRSTYCSATTLALLFATGVASAQEPDPWFAPEPPANAAPLPPPPPAPPGLAPLPPGAPTPPNIVTRPDGSASVTRTPEGGVDVHAQTSAGTVHAYGCSRVDVDPNTRSESPPGPCPYPHASPYPYPPPPPAYAPPPPMGRPRLVLAPYAPYAHKTKKPQWAPDPSRRNALIASSITFGLGTMLMGSAYVVTLAASAVCDFGQSCRVEPSQTALWAMGAVLTFTPSIPRFVVGDVGKGILYTALRAGSFAAGTLVDWNDPTYLVPISLAFIAPLTLGIVDLATTPHREQLVPRRERAGGFELQGLGPTAARDYRGNLIPAFGAVGSF